MYLLLSDSSVTGTLLCDLWIFSGRTPPADFAAPIRELHTVLYKAMDIAVDTEDGFIVSSSLELAVLHPSPPSPSPPPSRLFPLPFERCPLLTNVEINSFSNFYIYPHLRLHSRTAQWLQRHF